MGWWARAVPVLLQAATVGCCWGVVVSRCFSFVSRLHIPASTVKCSCVMYWVCIVGSTLPARILIEQTCSSPYLRRMRGIAMSLPAGAQCCAGRSTRAIQCRAGHGRTIVSTSVITVRNGCAHDARSHRGLRCAAALPAADARRWPLLSHLDTAVRFHPSGHVSYGFECFPCLFRPYQALVPSETAA